MTAGLPPFAQMRARPSDVAGVWHLRLPFLPWKRVAAEGELSLLIDHFTHALPAQALWFSDWTSDKKAGWQLLSPDTPWQTFESDLIHGAWALFFFASEAAARSALALHPTPPSSTASALKTLQDLRAGAGIWSWMDDTEWLVATVHDPA